jgi:hypothetical protein
MRRKGQGSASISAVVVFLSALLALGLMATILPPVANVLSGFREGLRERGERGSELIRIYIHTANETELEPPIITIINGYDRESVLTDYVVVARDGRVLAAGKMGGSLGGIRIPAGARIDLTPADFGLSYGTFAAMADEVKAIYVRTAEGNSFGSSYGPPPKINPDYQLSITQRSQHIIVIGSTTTRYNFTILGNLTLPTTGDALVVKNVILVDRDGFVRGGATAGSKWSDDSFDPNNIPDSLAALSKTDVVPIGGYYAVPPFPTNCFGVYSWCDASQQYIEMVEFYPVEYYTPGSPVAAAAYYARYGGETQTVYNPDWSRMVTITAQRPAVLQYGYPVPGVYIQSVIATYISSGARTRTYTTTLVTPVTVWQEGNLIKYAPIFDPRLAYYSDDQWSDGCRFEFDGGGGQYRCDFTLRPPTADWVRLRAIKGVGFEVLIGYTDTVCYNEDVFSKVTYVVNVIYPRGSYTARNEWRWSMWGDLRVGDVSFAFEIRMEPCQQPGNGRIIGWFTGWVVYEGFWRAATATATLAGNVMVTQTVTTIITYNYITWTCAGYPISCYWIYAHTIYTTTYTTTPLVGISINLKDQMKSAIVNGTQTLSGDAVAHLAGTVQGGQVIKIKAPIVLLNYIYGIAASPPGPPSGGGGGGGEIGVKIVCTLDQSVQSIMPPPSDSGSSSSGRSLESISGGTVPDFSVQQNTITLLRNVFCRPAR